VVRKYLLTLRLNYDKYGKHQKPVGGERRHSRFSSQENRQNTIQMRTSTTNRFLTKTLRTLCCVGALTACSAWATVVPWQLNPSLSKDSSQSGYTATARGFGDTASIDASHQYSFRASESIGASETSSALDDTVKNKIQVSLTSSSDQSLLFAASNAPTRSATELDEAMTKSFDEEFVSVPTVQFASTASAAGAPDASGASLTSGPGPMPVPEMSALFPIVGLIAAVSCTQILRRRRAAQQSAARIVG
jgi:hypothetical protein